MLNVGPAEFLIIGLVLLIAVGPEQLPSVIRKVGQTVGQLRSMTDGLRSEFMAGLEELERTADLDQWRSAPTTSSSKPSSSSSNPSSSSSGSTSTSTSSWSSPPSPAPEADSETDPPADPTSDEEPPGDPAGER